MLKPRLRRPPAVIKFSGNESHPLILKQAGFPPGAEMADMFYFFFSFLSFFRSERP